VIDRSAFQDLLKGLIQMRIFLGCALVNKAEIAPIPATTLPWLWFAL